MYNNSGLPATNSGQLAVGVIGRAIYCEVAYWFEPSGPKAKESDVQSRWVGALVQLGLCICIIAVRWTSAASDRPSFFSSG